MDDLPANFASEIISRIKKIERFRFDADVAIPLCVEKTRIATWKARNTVPYEKLVKYSRINGVSLDWLLNGRGPQKGPLGVGEEAARYGAIPTVNSDVFITVGREVDKVLDETGVDPNAEKRDRLVIIVYNDIIAKEGKQDISSKKILDLVKLVG